MSDLKSRLPADRCLYNAADDSLRALRDDLIRRARASGDYSLVVDFGERLLRYGCRSIAGAAGNIVAAEHAYRAADDAVAAPLAGEAR